MSSWSCPAPSEPAAFLEDRQIEFQNVCYAPRQWNLNGHCLDTRPPYAPYRRQGHREALGVALSETLRRMQLSVA